PRYRVVYAKVAVVGVHLRGEFRPDGSDIGVLDALSASWFLRLQGCDLRLHVRQPLGPELGVELAQVRLDADAGRVWHRDLHPELEHRLSPVEARGAGPDADGDLGVAVHGGRVGDAGVDRAEGADEVVGPAATPWTVALDGADGHL